MHQADVAESLWAIEKENLAANAYRLNNPKTIVFLEDCNKLLQRVMNVSFYHIYALCPIHVLNNKYYQTINIMNRIDILHFLRFSL